MLPVQELCWLLVNKSLMGELFTPRNVQKLQSWAFLPREPSSEHLLGSCGYLVTSQFPPTQSFNLLVVFQFY